MQNAIVIATFALVPILALVWLCGIPGAWQGRYRLPFLASAGLIIWPVLLIAVYTFFDHGDGYGALALGVVVFSAIGLGFAGLILSLLVGIAGRLWRKSKES